VQVCDEREVLSWQALGALEARIAEVRRDGNGLQVHRRGLGDVGRQNAIAAPLLAGMCLVQFPLRELDVALAVGVFEASAVQVKLDAAELTPQGEPSAGVSVRPKERSERAVMGRATAFKAFAFGGLRCVVHCRGAPLRALSAVAVAAGVLCTPSGAVRR